MSQLSSGLVMEGGAMRGMFTAGVTDVFMEQNIHFDGAVGVSAGPEISTMLIFAIVCCLMNWINSTQILLLPILWSSIW